MKLKHIIIGLFIQGFIFLNLPTVLAAEFNFSPSTQTFYRECRNRVNLLINPDGDESNAADIEMYYNPSQITIIDSNSSLPGIQIGQGDAYEAYFGNQVDTGAGIIRLAGASFVNDLTTQKTFAFIEFQSNPGFGGTTAIEINFDGFGETKDSNIAESGTSEDLLDDVTNGSYSFVLSPFGSCVADTTGPNVSFINPTPSSNGNPANSSINFTITDNISGTDLTTLEIIINGIRYISTDPEVTITGTPTSYNLSIVPRSPVFPNGYNTVIVNASDLAGNPSSRQMIFNSPVVPTSTPRPTSIITPRPTLSCPEVNECPNCPECPEPVECTIEQIISEIGTTGVEREICQDRVIETIREIAVQDSIAINRYLSAGLALAGILSNLTMLSTPGLLLNAFGMLLGKKNKTPWGIVMDSTTRQPIQFAVCKLFIGGTTNQIDQTISDSKGVYGFVITPGNYRLEVTKSGYADKIIKFSVEDGSYGFVQDVYLEQTMLQAHSSHKKVNRLELIDKLKTIFVKTLNILFVVGMIISIYSVVTDPSAWNWIILTGYIVICTVMIMNAFDFKEKYSSIIDYTTSLRIPNALIKIFDLKSGVLVDTKLTNSAGYFDYWDRPGTFGLFASVRGYSFPSEIQTEYDKVELNNVTMLKVNLKKGKNKLKILVDPIDKN